MSSIKEIARLAEVSIGTASFVLNGKGDKMRISKATQQRVMEISKNLGYRPNISARRLSTSGNKNVPVIAILWTLDARASLIGRFLRGIHDRLDNEKNPYELVIQPYENAKLDRVDTLLTVTKFHGAIVANASEKDMEYLENTEIRAPIVLYQRASEKYSNVNVDSFKTGSNVAELFRSRGHSNVGMIVPSISSQAIHLRTAGFREGAVQQGIQLLEENVLYQLSSEEGGYLAAKELIRRKEMPTALFFVSDTMAAGALAAFHEAGISIPQDLELVGHDNYAHTKFTVPSMSTIHLPVEEMAGECVKMLLDMINNRIQTPSTKLFDTSFVFRESCGEFKKA